MGPVIEYDRLLFRLVLLTGSAPSWVAANFAAEWEFDGCPPQR